MKGSVLILGAGVMQVPAILKAKEMGLYVIASDKNPQAPGFKHADFKLELDTKDYAGHVRFALEKQAELNIVGVFPGADVAVTAAHVSKALGLPGVSVEIAERSNNKALMKKRWLQDGVPTPVSIEVKTLEEAQRAVKDIGLPAIIKAVDNAASRGSRKIYSEIELDLAYGEAVRFSSSKTALVEELVEGPEQSVETIVYKGRHHRFGIVDRHFAFDPFPIETGHTNPTRLSKETQEKIYAVVKKAAISLGIDYGPAKADMVLTKKGPMIFEMPARLSGGFHSQYTTPLATGMDPIRAALRLAIGERFDPQDEKVRMKRTSICSAIFPEPGRVVRISGVEKARKIPGVADIFVMVREGDQIRNYQNCAHRVCYVITVGDTPQEARGVLEEVKHRVKIVTEPVGKESACL